MEILPSLSDVKRLRKKLNISQKDLGEILNIPQSTISRIENGTIDPPYSKLKKIFEYLENERKIREKSKKHAEDIMVHDIISIESSSTIRKAVDLMNKHEISQLPIIENNQNLGSITSKKIQKYITDNPQIINMDVSLIKELPFPEIDKNWNVKDISDLLLKYPAVLVKENNDYIGIVTDSDLLRLPNKK
ncbi:MAG: CBS domain-containing protein [Promethearchaeota archaeon]|nr:MAG: CBS domain-containing protein [Candidatus Lokiarchaeota archaeon]